MKINQLTCLWEPQALCQQKKGAARLLVLHDTQHMWLNLTSAVQGSQDMGIKEEALGFSTSKWAMSFSWKIHAQIHVHFWQDCL